jgi:60S ribosome subunit biogenesis protein NIP7
MTKTGKFRLHITALPIIASGARHKIWVKENGAQPFLYGSNGWSSPGDSSWFWENEGC